MVRTYRLAERTVRIDSLYDRVHDYCRDYLWNEADPADIQVKICQEDLDFEACRSTLSPVPPEDYLEELAVYRQIAEQMPLFDTFLFHGSALAVDGRGVLFAAASGTGKSTHARLWREYLGDRAKMINDDKPLIRIKDGGAYVYGTPWNGKHRLGSNTWAKLEAICLLERGEKNSITPISQTEAYPGVLRQVYRPADRRSMMKTMELVDALGKTVRFYRLHCNMDPDAARVSCEGILGLTRDLKEV